MDFIADHFQLIRCHDDFLTVVELFLKPTVLGVIESVVPVEILRSEGGFGIHGMVGIRRCRMIHVDHNGIRPMRFDPSDEAELAETCVHAYYTLMEFRFYHHIAKISTHHPEVEVYSLASLRLCKGSS